MVFCFINTPEVYYLEEKAKEGIEFNLEDSDSEVKIHYFLHSESDRHFKFYDSGIIENTIEFIFNHQGPIRLFLLYGQMKTDIC